MLSVDVLRYNVYNYINISTTIQGVVISIFTQESKI